MSRYRSSVIVNSIRSLLEGATGVVRRVPPGLFKFGAFDGQPESAMKAAVLEGRYKHRFDVVLGDKGPHASTGFSARTNRKNAVQGVTINIYTVLKTTPEEELRRAQRDMIADNVETALQALQYPGNLLLDLNSTPTGVISGLLMGEDGSFGGAKWAVVDEDWTQQIHRGRITGAVLLEITQAVNVA